VFVSVAFPTYALLAGPQSIPGDIYEAPVLDGCSPPVMMYPAGSRGWGRWGGLGGGGVGGGFGSLMGGGDSWRGLRLLRPAFLVAAPHYIINVFHSFPIIWEIRAADPDTKRYHNHLPLFHSTSFTLWRGVSK